MVEATVISNGIGAAGDIVALDSTGKLDVSVLPVGVGPDVTVAEAVENLTAGRYVNIFNDGGVPKVRLADSSNDRPAHGYVKVTVAIGASATVFFEGPNQDLSGIVAGQRYYLSTAGQPMTAVPVLPTNVIHQFLGVGIDANTINTDIEDAIVL
jgi:cyanophycinase-like exopeptidase